MLDELLQGKPVPEKDANALLEFYGKLSSTFAIAEETERGHEFETRTTMEAILRKKIPHLSAKWTEKAVKSRINDDKELKFGDFLKFINERHDYLDQYNRTMAGSNSQATSRGTSGGAKVAATTASSTAPASKPSAKSTGCAACGANHSMSDCKKFAEMETGAKRKVCMSVGACFRCLESGHVASSCKAEVKCEKCQKAHHSAAHDLQLKEKKAAEAATTEVKLAA